MTWLSMLSDTKISVEFDVTTWCLRWGCRVYKIISDKWNSAEFCYACMLGLP